MAKRNMTAYRALSELKRLYNEYATERNSVENLARKMKADPDSYAENHKRAIREKQVSLQHTAGRAFEIRAREIRDELRASLAEMSAPEALSAESLRVLQSLQYYDLSPVDYQTLAIRYRGDSNMSRILVEMAKKNNIVIEGSYQAPDAVLSQFDEAVSAIGRLYKAETADAKFNELAVMGIIDNYILDCDPAHTPVINAYPAPQTVEAVIAMDLAEQRAAQEPTEEESRAFLQGFVPDGKEAEIMAQAMAQADRAKIANQEAADDGQGAE